MWANNETGVIEPAEAIGALCRQHGVRFHTDATQWVGKMPTDVNAVEIDYLSFAGHKFHGPKGTGALWTRPGLPVVAQVVGGPQERRHRGGTENAPALFGFGVAADLARKWIDGGGPAVMDEVHARFEASLHERIPGLCVNGTRARRVWSTTSVGVPGLESELVLLMLSERGLCASSGSACSSGAMKPSPRPRSLRPAALPVGRSRLRLGAIQHLPGHHPRPRSSWPPRSPQRWSHSFANSSHRRSRLHAKADTTQGLPAGRSGRLTMPPVGLHSAASALLAQLAEQLTLNQRVVGSSPTQGTSETRVAGPQGSVLHVLVCGGRLRRASTVLME